RVSDQQIEQELPGKTRSRIGPHELQSWRGEADDCAALFPLEQIEVNRAVSAVRSRHLRYEPVESVLLELETQMSPHGEKSFQATIELRGRSGNLLGRNRDDPLALKRSNRSITDGWCGQRRRCQ